MLLEIVLPLIVSWSLCLRKNKRKRKTGITKIDDGIIRISKGNKSIFVGGFRIVDVDSVKIYENFYETLRQYARLIHGGSSDVILQVHLLRRPIDKRNVLTKIEREITSLRIIKMSDPTDVKVDNKLKVLENLYRVLSEGSPPVAVDVDYVFCSPNLMNLKSEMQYVRSTLEELFGAHMAPLSPKELTRRCSSNIDGIKTQVTVAETLTLTPVSLVAPRVSGVYIGLDTNDRPFFISKDELKRHIIVTGATGTGKTSFLATLILRTMTMFNVSDIVVVDPKGDLEYYLSLLDIDVTIYRFRGDPRRRRDEIEKYMKRVLRSVIDQEPTSELTTMIVVDEVWLINMEIIEDLIREGRSKGIAVVLASQNLTDFSEVVRLNAHTKISFRLNEVHEDACKIFKEKCSTLDKLSRGEALVKTLNNDIFRITVDVSELLQSFTSTTLKSSTPNSRSSSFTTSPEEPSSSTNI